MEKMVKHASSLWVLTLLLGWCFDLLFWKKGLGINFALFILLSLVGGLAVLVSSRHYPDYKSLWLLLPLVFFSAFSFVRREPLTTFLACTFTVFSLGLFAATYLGGRWYRYSLLDYLSNFFRLFISLLVRPLEFFSQARKERAETREGKRLAAFWPVLRGLLIALPTVMCFTYLLTSADLVFNHQIRTFFERLDVPRILEYLLRLALIPVYAYPLAGAVLHAAARSRDEKLVGEERPLIRRFLGFTETGIVLTSVAVLFLLFVLVQFRYFFGGEQNIGVEGFTYSQYARRGFSELLTVAFFSLLLVLGFSTVTVRESPLHRRLYSGLSLAIVAEVSVILVSSFQRITLANQWHGFSRLRIYPQVFLVWLGVLFLAVVLLEVFHRERYFALAAVLASMGFAASLSLLNVDALIVRHNVQRAVEGRHFNVTHLAMLSSDAVPALAGSFSQEGLPDEVREGVGAALTCHANSNSSLLPPEWQSFHLAPWRAHQALAALEGQFAGYEVIERKRSLQVRTPGGEEYLCEE